MATLKISDLSVGDWVGIDQAELNIPSDDLATAYIEKLRKPIRIKGISEDSDTVLADIETVDGWGSIMMKCEYLHPIPITAEILEKNGFVKKNYDNGKMWDWWCDNVLVRKYADEDIYRFIVALSSMHYTTTMVVGKHTHQLQHALRLAVVDKEINL